MRNQLNSKTSTGTISACSQRPYNETHYLRSRVTL